MKYTASRSILGFLVCTLHFIDPDTVTAILEMLCATGKPVTVFQETGRRSFSYTDKIRANPLVKIIAVDSSTASGYDMGRFLYGLGHRRVACFMHDDESAWVRSRYHGIIAAFADRGVPDAVAGVSLDPGPSATVYAAAVYEKKPYENLIRAVLDFQNRTEPWSVAEQAPFFTVDALPYIWNRYLGREMAPLFGRVLSDKSISAWVGITDAIAIYALDYLKRNGAKVPAEISVAGFDDSTDAFCYGLTSYNFNAPAVAGRIVSHILSAKRHARSGKKAAICEEMRGLVKIRRSTSSKVY